MVAEEMLVGCSYIERMWPTDVCFTERNIRKMITPVQKSVQIFCFTGRQISGLMLLKMYWHLALYCINFYRRGEIAATIHTSCSVQTATPTLVDKLPCQADESP